MEILRRLMSIHVLLSLFWSSSLYDYKYTFISPGSNLIILVYQTCFRWLYGAFTRVHFRHCIKSSVSFIILTQCFLQGYSADEDPLVPTLKLSMKRTVRLSKGTVVPPDCEVVRKYFNLMHGNIDRKKHLTSTNEFKTSKIIAWIPVPDRTECLGLNAYFQFFSPRKMKGMTYRRHESHPTRTIIMCQANQLLLLLIAECQARNLELLF